MTCVLSMSAVYNNPCCGGFRGGGGGTDETASQTDFDYHWINSSSPRLATDTGTTTCSCRFDKQTTLSRTPAKLERPGLRKEESTNNCCKNDTHEIEMKVDERRTIGVKRKLDSNTEDLIDRIPPKRISPFLNTPKERKEERRRVLKISIQKLRQMEDPEHFLRRSVLINNTLKKVQKEIREEKQKSYQGYKSCIYRLRPHYSYDVLNNSYLQASPNGYMSMFEGQYSNPDESEKFQDEITDTLVKSLEETSAIKDNISTNSSSPLLSRQTESHGINMDDRTEIDISTSESHREKQICNDMDAVFNNLIRALGET
ncbi:uncharacterized protein LOC110452789 [Mizuhopecten yessoensis]|uniref:SERTA domain-containing protein 4 n=1 Tax=Mizuhopecten yessoensis TaxID=6573 RepID=A0A210QJ88_MIZYE|nr:uncharacterized protein LOC110452789 [Mizuhopecten yessoensis]OWF48661.1 SERTA domain-containing protein 4 [Mizuhopecten yessoensis]